MGRFGGPESSRSTHARKPEQLGHSAKTFSNTAAFWLNSATTLREHNHHRALQKRANALENSILRFGPRLALPLTARRFTTVKRKEGTMNSIRKSASMRTLAAVTTTALFLTAGLALAQDYAPPADSPDRLNNQIGRAHV